ncbi:MAG: hypothetical protein Kow0099_33300 [Candidatus Abyssubacteria bacterium]
MPDTSAPDPTYRSIHDENLKRDIDRVNARLRHYRGVAASVLDDAQRVWLELWEACRDPRSCQQILDDGVLASSGLPSCGWPEFLEKLHLLGHYIDYTKRLCDGSLDHPDAKKGV